MREKRRSFRLIGLLMLLLITLLSAVLSGCSKQPNSAEAALATARSFMQARVAGNSRAAHALLTPAARKAITLRQVDATFQAARATYGSLGTPQVVEPGVIRVPVKELVLAEPDRQVHWPERWLTLQHDGESWQVAWAEPLFTQAAQAYRNDLAADALRHAKAILAIDRHHYRGHLELHFAYRGQKRYREAEVALQAALELATPAEKADVHDAFARFQLAIGAPAGAITHAQQALELAAPYGPDTYSARWQADTLVVAARAALALGDRATAEALANDAATRDPENATLAIFHHRLAGR